MNTIFKDIETCPAQDPVVLQSFRDALAIDFKPPSTLTKEKAAADLGIIDKDEIKFTSKDSMIARWADQFRDEAIEDTAQEQWRKTSFDGALGHICVIGFAFDDDEPQAIWSHDWLKDERQVLREFFARVDERIARQPNVRPTFVGHNILGFDFRFIYQRAVMLDVAPSRNIPFGASKWDESVFDTMIRWAGPTGTIKQDKLARLLGGKGKGEIDGSMVWDYVRDGKIENVADYCKEDVADARVMYRRMTFAPVPEKAALLDIQF